jgi:outer membrane lipoprotein-sorting protein
VLLAQATAEADPPGVMTIVHDMQEVFEPDRPSVRKIEISISGESRLYTRWAARKAVKNFPKGKRTLIALLDPRDVRGNALLIKDREDQEDDRWVYVPAVRRVRKILPVTAYEPFLNTDFTYADLGFLDHPGTYKLLGDEKRAGEAAYKVDFTPQSDWYYSHIVIWVSKDTHLPLERDYYDVAKNLWKKETFEKITVINGIPTPLRIRMKDIRNLTESTFDITEVRYDVDVPDDLFNPASLPKAAESPFWETLESAD